MITAIIYASKHGTTQKVSNEISKHLAHHEVAIFNIRDSYKIDLSFFDQVIIGGSIHAGTIQKSLQQFINQNTTVLLQKNIALFLCCMYEKEAQSQFDKAFPYILRNHASSCQCVGGEFIFEKMSFMEKFMTKKIAGIRQSVSKINHENIEKLALEMK